MSFLSNRNSHQLRTAVCSLLVGCAAFAAGCTLSSTPKDAVASPQTTTTQSGAKLSPARDTPVVRAARLVGPTVVGITNKAVARDWFNNQIQVEQGVGSGVIFRADGYIVTNNHVIEGAKEIIVSLSDGRTVNGKLIGADPLTDIAVVKIDGKDLTAATFGNSDEIVVGEPAIAIGNAHGNYVAMPNLAFDRLKELRTALDLPLVLHGGSGIENDYITRGIKAGIAKINVGTELRQPYEAAMREKNDVEYARERVYTRCRELIRDFLHTANDAKILF